MANKQHIYSDLDLRFTPSPTTGDVAMKYDTQAVIASVRNLLNTNKYDRPFQPDISCGLNTLLFEPLSSITATLIENEIIRVLTNHEPRVRVNSLMVSVSERDNAFNVYLSVFIGNMTQPSAINLILKRTR